MTVRVGRLGRDDVHLWRVALNEVDVPRMDNLLSDEEHRRADSFRFAESRREFVATRGVLRQMLAMYTAQRPRDMQFRSNERGKPNLDSDLQFNISHAGEVALIVLSHAAVGVDIEHIDANFDYSEIALCFFSEAEREWLAAQPARLRNEAFFVLWTRREAYVKARGTGVPTEGVCGLSPVIYDEQVVWSIRSLRPCPRYIGAVSAAIESCSVTLYTWPAKSFTFAPENRAQFIAAEGRNNSPERMRIRPRQRLG